MICKNKTLSRNEIIMIIENGGYRPVHSSFETDFFDSENRSLAVLPRDEKVVVIPYGRVINQISPYLDRDTILAQRNFNRFYMNNDIPTIEQYYGDKEDLKMFAEVFSRLGVLQR